MNTSCEQHFVMGKMIVPPTLTMKIITKITGLIIPYDRYIYIYILTSKGVWIYLYDYLSINQFFFFPLWLSQKKSIKFIPPCFFPPCVGQNLYHINQPKLFGPFQTTDAWRCSLTFSKIPFSMASRSLRWNLRIQGDPWPKVTQGEGQGEGHGLGPEEFNFIDIWSSYQSFNTQNINVWKGAFLKFEVLNHESTLINMQCFWDFLGVSRPRNGVLAAIRATLRCDPTWFCTATKVTWNSPVAQCLQKNGRHLHRFTPCTIWLRLFNIYSHGKIHHAINRQTIYFYGPWLNHGYVTVITRW